MGIALTCCRVVCPPSPCFSGVVVTLLFGTCAPCSTGVCSKPARSSLTSGTITCNSTHPPFLFPPAAAPVPRPHRAAGVHLPRGRRHLHGQPVLERAQALPPPAHLRPAGPLPRRIRAGAISWNHYTMPLLCLAFTLRQTCNVRWLPHCHVWAEVWGSLAHPVQTFGAAKANVGTMHSVTNNMAP